MSDEKRPFRVITNVEDVSEMDQIRRALLTHKNWIWGDGIEIAKLRTKMKHLEADLDDLKGFLERLLKKSDN